MITTGIVVNLIRVDSCLLLTFLNTKINNNRWRVGELRARENAGRAQPSEEMLAAVETAAKRISESNAPEAEQQQLLSSGSSPFIDASHPLHDFFKWRLTLASAPPPPKKTGHVTFALNHRAPGNTPLSMGQLFTMLAPLLESKNSKPGIFIDPNGHVVIPAGVFDPPSEN